MPPSTATIAATTMTPMASGRCTSTDVRYGIHRLDRLADAEPSSTSTSRMPLTAWNAKATNTRYSPNDEQRPAHPAPSPLPTPAARAHGTS